MTENEKTISEWVKEQTNELKAYRAIGTVERFRFLQEVCDLNGDELENIANSMIELKNYRAIGTIEEFKTLKEKNEPKKIAHQGCYDADGVLHIWNGINGVPYDLCPNCEINLCTDGRFGRDKSKIKYCENCGQKLDWSER